jgi:hypothetical protein
VKKTKENKSCLLQIIGSAIGGVIFFFLLKYVFWWVPNLADALEYVKEPLKNSIFCRVIGLTIFIMIAILLIQLKKKLIVAFGLFEIVGGGWTIWTTFNQNFENDILYALAIGGGVFLLINGLENIEKQKEQDKNEKP